MSIPSLLICSRIHDDSGQFRSKELVSTIENAIANGEIDKLINDFCADILKKNDDSRLSQIRSACRVIASLPDEQQGHSQKILNCLKEKGIVFSDFSQYFTDDFINRVDYEAFTGLNSSEKEACKVNLALVGISKLAARKSHVLSLKLLLSHLPSTEFVIKRLQMFPEAEEFDTFKYKNAIPLIIEKWKLWDEISASEKDFFYTDSTLDYKKIEAFLGLYRDYDWKQMSTFAQLVKALFRDSAETPLPIEEATGKQIGLFDKATVLPIVSFLRKGNEGEFGNILKLSDKDLVVDLFAALSRIPPLDVKDILTHVKTIVLAQDDDCCDLIPGIVNLFLRTPKTSHSIIQDVSLQFSRREDLQDYIR